MYCRCCKTRGDYLKVFRCATFPVRVLQEVQSRGLEGLAFRYAALANLSSVLIKCSVLPVKHTLKKCVYVRRCYVGSRWFSK